MMARHNIGQVTESMIDFSMGYCICGSQLLALISYLFNSINNSISSIRLSNGVWLYWGLCISYLPIIMADQKSL